VKNQTLLTAALLVALALPPCLVYLQYERNLDTIRVAVHEELRDHAVIKGRELEQFFSTAYDGIRTISFLPGIQSITPGVGLDAN
jgi:hypothetical protein